MTTQSQQIFNNVIVQDQSEIEVTKVNAPQIKSIST